MNAVEIEQAITDLAEAPFDRDEFPFAFLEAFGNRATTIRRLRKGESNKSDLGGVLQTGNVHILTAEPGDTPAALAALRTSRATGMKQLKVRFLVATDGETFEAEDRITSENVVCAYRDFPNQFGLFLPLAGISTVKAIRENAFDVRATSRLNRLYVQLLQDNPDWGGAERRPDLNHFFARLIFCFFAEDTDILNGADLFTATVQQMGDDNNTHHVIAEIFRAMNVASPNRDAENVPRWAGAFPYVNGGLFSGSIEVPAFSKIARRYLIHIGNLDWRKINPDIFGSMIQAVADDEERGALGMHYTSVPNILKVLNPLFLDDLRAQLEAAGDNARKLLNLRKRMARIRVFDPACGSGNFLVIAYKEMRAIEAEVNVRRHETGAASVIPLTNFRGIEIRDFSAEIARLALIIAEYQCDVLHRGQMEALAEFLPLDAENWITCGNALRLDWLKICPPTGSDVRVASDDLVGAEPEQAQVEFENEGGEIYLCGNPPYLGARKQGSFEKADLMYVFEGHKDFKDSDYVLGWALKGASFCSQSGSTLALVMTSSVVQGEQAQFLWPRVWDLGLEAKFAYRPFRWSNNAAKNAGVFVVVLGLGCGERDRTIYDQESSRVVDSISPYLVAGPKKVVVSTSRPLSCQLTKVVMGNMARDGGGLIMQPNERSELVRKYPKADRYLSPLVGTTEIVNGTLRYAIHIRDEHSDWTDISPIVSRINSVQKFRESSKAKTTNGYASVSHRFAQYSHQDIFSIAFPSVVPSGRFLVTPVVLDGRTMVTNLAYVAYGACIFELSILSSTLHFIWAKAVSGRLGEGMRYTPTISHHSFPVPPLTQKNQDDLTACAERILLTRESHFPATIADLYDLHSMPDDLRAAHEANDETLERIYIGRRFKNDTERLEHLFALYTKMTEKESA